MASIAITSWQIDGEAMETVIDSIFLGSKITANSDCSHEIFKRWVLLGRKAMTNIDSIDSILKSRCITLQAKVHIVKAMVFPVVMQRCEIWIIKKAEWWRIDTFSLWCFRLFRVPWASRKSNQSVCIFIGRTDAEVKAPILWPPDVESTLWKKPWCWEWLKAEGEGDGRGREGWMASPTQWTRVWANFRRWWRTEKTGMLHPWGRKESDMTEQLNNNK